MVGDVPKMLCYARKAKTPNANDRICDIVGAERRLLVGLEICEGTDDRDRISNLPQDVVQCILERLSVRDAARTSILSKEWRYKWGMKNNLVFDESFFVELTSNKDKDTHGSALSRAIEMIILVHKGSLLSFNLYIPPKFDQCLISGWIEHFLNDRIRVLEITNSEKNAFEIPLFVCERLVELKLTTGILNPLPKPWSFRNLIRVELLNISITADISFGSQLKKLFLLGCTGIQYLACHFTNANNLTDLILYRSEKIEWRWLDCTKQLKFFGLALTKKANPDMRKPINLIKFLRNTDTISKILLNGYTVEVLGPFYPKKGLAPKIELLELIGIGFHNFCQLFNCLCLIRCLPNLQILKITLEPGILKTIPSVEQYQEVLSWRCLSLNQLHTVEIRGVVGESDIIHSIRFLLARSPSLRVMSLFCNIKANAHEEIWKIRQELQQCPRKSSVVKLCWAFL